MEISDIEKAWEEVLHLEEPNSTIQEDIDAQPSADLFLLHTRQNRVLAQIIKYDDADSVKSSNFNANVPTAVVVHGWLENKGSLINPILTQALLINSDMNVIVMDWSRWSQLDYISSTKGVPSVGRGLGQFLAFLNQATGMSYDTVHLIGFSLGGHVVGNAGRFLDGQVARITALDPAGPLWYFNDQRLRNTDAHYVEAIHTNAGGFGISLTVGDTDFYPNGGTSQPGCTFNNIDNPVCNHFRSYMLFAASINRNSLVGRQCLNVLAFVANLCFGKSLPMGNTDLTKSGSGVYRLTTTSVYPYK